MTNNAIIEKAKNQLLAEGKIGSHESYFVSPLTAFRENSKQFNNALQEGRTRKASIVEFTDITGKVSKRYWNGATYTDRSSSLFEKEFKGTYKVSFKKPKEW